MKTREMERRQDTDRRGGEYTNNKESNKAINGMKKDRGGSKEKTRDREARKETAEVERESVLRLYQ